MPNSPVDTKGAREVLGPVLPQPLSQKEPFESPAQSVPPVLAGAHGAWGAVTPQSDHFRRS